MSVAERLGIRSNSVTNRIRRMPVLVLMPHSRCNCRCLMCDIWRANKQLREIGPELVEPYVRTWQSMGVRWVLLSGGEALMHSNLWRLCESLAPLKAKVSLLSTGLLLERHAADIRTWSDEIIVSLDGSEEVHDRIRNIPRAFERLEKGVTALRREAPGVELGARCVIQRENYHDMAGIIDAAKDLQLDWVSFLAADVSSEAFNRPEGWSEEKVEDVRLSREQCDEFEGVLQGVFEAHYDDFQTGFIVESPRKLLDLLSYFRALNGDAAFPAHRCNAPWVSAVIEADGEVRPCYFHEPYGNIHEGEFAKIVNSPAAIDFRKQLDVTKNLTCQRCVCTFSLR